MASGKSSLVARIFIVLVIVGCLYAAYHYLYRNKSADSDAQDSSGGSPSSVAKGSEVAIGIAYGTEKKSWLEWAVQEFGSSPEGRKIKVNLIPKGSLEGAQALVAGDKSIQVWSPASSLYKDTFVQDWQVKYSNNPILKEESLALTPMVFVMWDERYQAFVQKYKSLSFATIGQALQEKGGWDAIAQKPDWGLFKFGHTHPNESNSGLMAIVLAAYSYQKKTKDLTLK